MVTMGESKTGSTQKRWVTACKGKAFDLIRDLKLVETRAEQFWKVLNAGTISTNTLLRRLHNFAVDMNWILAAIIPRRQWPKIHFKAKRAITVEENLRIAERKHNPRGRSSTSWRCTWALRKTIWPISMPRTSTGRAGQLLSSE
jgi:hypothetical protein